jgi:predicted nucleic acid-binding protein
MEEPVVLDSDTLSELSRGHPRVVARTRAYLERHGRLTTTAVTVFERLRGYRAALAAGKPFEAQLRSFESLVACSRVLPLDAAAASLAASIWGVLDRRDRRSLGDILIAAITSVHGLTLATRNQRDFSTVAALPFVRLRLCDWTR